MAGERMPQSLNSNPSSLSETLGSNQSHKEERRAADGGCGSTLNDKAGHTGKGGKVRLSRPTNFRKKPYDRPVHPGGLGISSSFNGHTPSLPSRLVDSASNLIVSSASYLFETFFKRRRALWIEDGIRSTARISSADMEHKECTKPLLENPEDDSALQGLGVGCCEKVEGEDSDLAEVEGILKQKSLSREEVKRLTYVLRKQSTGGPLNLEVYSQQQKVQQVREEPNPVKLAKAYMGESTARFVSTPSQWQSTPYCYGEGAGPSSVKRVRESFYGVSPMKASKSGLASTGQMLKRRLIADDDDNVTSKGPTRRVRQKMTIMPNSSPYIRQLNVGKGLQPSSMPVVPRIEQTDKVLEKPNLPAKGISVEEPEVVAACNVKDLAEGPKARESLCKNEALVLPTSSEVAKTSSTAVEEDVEIMVPVTFKAAGENATTGLSEASLPQLPAVPERSKGFCMNAFFEDSSSDEESGPAVKTSPSTETQQPVGSTSCLEAMEENTQEQPHARTFNDGSWSSDPKSTNKALSTWSQPSNAGGPSSVIFSSSPAALSQAMQSSASSLSSYVKPLPVVSCAPSVLKKELLPFTPSASAKAPSSVVMLMPPISASPPAGATSPATSISFSPMQGAASLSSSLAEVEKPSLIQNKAAAEGVEGAKSGSFSPVAASVPAKTIVTETPSLVAPSFTAPAATSEPSVALGITAALISVGSEPSLAGLPANVPTIFQGSTSGTGQVNTIAAPAQVDTLGAPESFVKAGGGVTFTSGGSPNADRQAEGDTMATDPMSEELDGSFTSSSTSPFLFGSASTAPTLTPLGQMPSFGSNASLPAPFSFSAPSSAPSGGSSSSAPFPFSSQSSNAGGQLFTFDSSVLPPSNPFSMNSQSSFSFSSSAAPSTSPIFTATSSALVTFSAPPAAPSFQFGASSSSTSATSMFGSQMTDADGAFAAPGSQNNSSAFAFGAPATSSGMSSSPIFQAGGAGASGPSFEGQAFTFSGGQPAHAASNPFGQSGTLNAAPFQFAASAATPSQSVFPSGNTTSSSLPFGAQQPSGSGFPFTFGAQPGALPAGQPFAFSGQPAAPVQSPFGFSGATGQNPFPLAGASGMDFGGGFSLGAVGGEKTGRKYIKAKRSGGVKRGK